MAFLVAAAGRGEASPGRIENLAVEIQLAGGEAALPPPVKKRMQASVYTIADNVLMGRQIREVAAQKAEYGRLVQEVFDRILLGYTVERVEISPQATAGITVWVAPWQDVIQKVDVSAEAYQVADEVEGLALNDIRGVQQVFDQILLGLPVDAAEWTNGIVKNSLQDFLAAKLPEFRGSFEITAGETAKVQLVLYPKGALVRGLDLSLRSESMPNLALFSYRPSIEKKMGILIGAPVAFVERHKDYFTQYFKAGLPQGGLLKDLGVRTAVCMDVGANTKVDIDADTDKYHVFIEGYLDISKQEDNTSVRIHAGKKISPADEVFLEADFFPHQMKWMFMPGFSHGLTPKLTLGYKYDLDAADHILWVKQKLGDKYLLRLEHVLPGSHTEFALRYKLHDFLSVEYVVNEDDRWLRMVGNF